jgi:hypothetical protein
MSTRYFNAGGATTTTPTAGTVNDPLAGTQTGTESSLSNWVGPYVTNMLGQGQALAQTPFQAYQGPLTAGTSQAQQQAFSGIAGLTVPTQDMGGFSPTSFTAGTTAADYMSPYTEAAIAPQIEEARRQAQIAQTEQAGRLTKAGAFGGSRQAIMDAELQRNLSQNISNIRGQGYQQAFDRAQQQFNVEQGRQQAAQEMVNRYGLDALGAQAALGAQERATEQEAINAARAQFEEERLFPYKQLQFQQSLLQGLPLAAASYSYQQPSGLAELLGGTEGFLGLIKGIFGNNTSAATPTPTTNTTPAPNQTFESAMNDAVAAGQIDQATADAILAGVS